MRSNRQKSILRRDALDALREAIHAADPAEIIRRKISISKGEFCVGDLRLDFDRIFVIGGGKASAGMALGLEKILGKRIFGGVVNIPEYLKPRPKTRRILLHGATHPIPSEKGVRGVEKMLELTKGLSRRDLVVCLISGGGSALMAFPAEGLKLEDEKQVTNLLLKSGAEIHEINTVRKHLSGIKGGRLAEHLYPASVLSLIISDVVGDDLDSIASGPTVSDPTTFSDVKEILLKYNLWRHVSGRVRRSIETGIDNKSIETPKPGSKIFQSVHNVLVGSNRQSCDAAARFLSKRGYNARILSTHIQGEAREVGKVFSGILIDAAKSATSTLPSAIVSGGETTVTIHGDGIGGRNQELVLSIAIGIEGIPDVLACSIGTDGVDGPTGAAGAIADGETLFRARRKKISARSYLENNDSYSFFKRLDDLIVTGPTGTNVNDVMIMLAGKRS